MWKNRILILAIIPLFAAGFLVTALLKTNPVHLEQTLIKNNPLGPQQISLVTPPIVQAEQSAPEQSDTKPIAKTDISSVQAQPRVQSSSTTTTPAPRLTPPCSGSFTIQFICLLNNYRAQKGLRPMTYSASLSAVALAHSTWMNTTGIFSHQESDGSRMIDRCSEDGITCHAENLAEGVDSPQDLLNMWSASGPHNANLLGAYSSIGIGISGEYITADFE